MSSTLSASVCHDVYESRSHGYPAGYQRPPLHQQPDSTNCISSEIFNLISKHTHSIHTPTHKRHFWLRTSITLDQDLLKTPHIFYILGILRTSAWFLFRSAPSWRLSPPHPQHRKITFNDVHQASNEHAHRRIKCCCTSENTRHLKYPASKTLFENAS